MSYEQDYDIVLLFLAKITLSQIAARPIPQVSTGVVFLAGVSANGIKYSMAYTVAVREVETQREISK